MLKQITITEAIGKTLAHIHTGDGRLFLRFTDDTILVLANEWRNDAGEIVEEEILHPLDLYRSDVVQSGLATAEEYDALYADRQQAQIEWSESSERAMYERLKAKFGEA